MRFAFLVVIVLLASSVVSGAPAPPDEAYVLLFDSGLLVYQANHYSLLHANEFDTHVENMSDKTQAWFRDYAVRPIDSPRGDTLFYRGEFIIPETAHSAFVYRGSSDERFREVAEYRWEQIPLGTVIEAYELWPYGNITGLTIFYTYNSSFPARITERWAPLYIADLAGAVRLSDRIEADVPPLEPSDLLSGRGIPTFGYYDGRVRTLGSYPDTSVGLEHSSSRWSLIDPDEYARVAIRVFVLLLIVLSAPITTLLVPRRLSWIGALVLPLSIIALVVSGFFVRSALLENLFGIPVILEMLVTLALWLLSVLSTVFLIGSRSPRS